MVRAWLAAALVTFGSCQENASPGTGRLAEPSFRRIHVRGESRLVENSAAVTSVRQPGIVFGINDSRHDATIFALDTAGAGRGSWSITGARNVDWEAAAIGPCGNVAGVGEAGTAPQGPSCLYIGDVGDNDARRPFVTLYRLREPSAGRPGPAGELPADRLDVRYPSGRYDVEAMFVAADAAVILITKRPMLGAFGRLRPALVFRVAPGAWGGPPVVAELVDSLPVVPEPRGGRMVTDAALSPDRTRLAVRTYREVFVIPVEPISGRVDRTGRWWSCAVGMLRERQGEGIGWMGDELVLSSEGRDAPLHIVRCDPPSP